MWVFIRNALLHKTRSWVRETMLIQEWAKRISECCGLVCVQCLWSRFRCWSRNTNRKWLCWTDQDVGVVPVLLPGGSRWRDFVGLCEQGHIMFCRSRIAIWIEIGEEEIKGEVVKTSIVYMAPAYRALPLTGHPDLAMWEWSHWPCSTVDLQNCPGRI